MRGEAQEEMETKETHQEEVECQADRTENMNNLLLTILKGVMEKVEEEKGQDTMIPSGWKETEALVEEMRGAIQEDTTLPKGWKERGVDLVQDYLPEGWLTQEFMR